MYIYDIGSNIGKFADASFNLYPQAHVVMVEANQQLADYLSFKYSDKNATIINKAVSSISDVEIDFYISNANTISTASTEWITNSRFTNKYTWNNVVKKTTISIDKLLEEYPNPEIIKIDVEGYEFEVIKGLTKKQKKICFEWAEEQETNIRNTCDYLEKLGYEKFGFIHGDEYLVEPTSWTNKETCLKEMSMIPERKEKWGMLWVV